ncbi:DUF2523 domain-containing protein [Ectopseudomonas guguanensis]|uniref:DUF2523 domain-containing protein n=1 Tax=Ectopseudomonas guguanensis TaxID=1198456 RepID=UPI00285F2ABE|nr:DUF2523 domain-containing protein [Pseudomonas guguanensis]MDR8016002.1 DUF2523 domain-containing protein [Pseudomonas guguanensis]
MHYLFLAQLLIMIVGPLVKMVLRVIGFGFVSYVGFNLVIDQARSYMQSSMGQLGAEISGILGLANFDIIVNMYFAAIATRFILAGIDKAQDRKRNQVWRKPGGTSIEA